MKEKPHKFLSDYPKHVAAHNRALGKPMLGCPFVGEPQGLLKSGRYSCRVTSHETLWRQRILWAAWRARNRLQDASQWYATINGGTITFTRAGCDPVSVEIPDWSGDEQPPVIQTVEPEGYSALDKEAEQIPIAWRDEWREWFAAQP